MAVTFDEGQRDAIGCSGNAVVSAGAGSGKTTVLAERYLRIVKEGLADVEQILTLTYTRKAAAEMYERIYARLLRESDDPLIKEQLARFDRAQISTLDSFCVQVLRNAPQHYGVRFDFTIGEEQGLRLDEETALAYLLDHSDDPALLAFIRLNGFEGVWKDFFASLGSSYLHLAENRDFAAIYRRQVESLIAIVAETIAALDRVGEEIRRIDPGAAKAIADAHERIAALPDLAAMAGSEEYEAIGTAAEEFRFNRRTGRADSAEVTLYKELADEFDRLRGELARAAFTLASREILRRLFEMCGEFQEILLRRKRASGALSFQDVVEMAVRLLTENRTLRRHYKQRYRYLMIDEFQDNNELQKRLLYLLAEREGEESPDAPGPDRIAADKLFFVGDQKQSIYRFRGADVSVFRGLADELSRSGGRAISLATNYRSAPPLIAFYNRFFARIFEGADADFEARFESLASGLEAESARQDASIRLFYKPYDGEAGEDEAHSDDAEAYHIARFIKESVEQGTLLVRDGEDSRPAGWGDFALLMRTTSNQIRYEKIFRRLNVPYSTQSVRTLFLEAPLNDLYAALQLAVYPDDRLAYATLLRSPLVGLEDPAVVEILLSGGEPFASLPPEIAADGPEGARFAAGEGLLLFLRESADVLPIARLIDEIWYRFGYRYNLLTEPSNHPYLEYYDYFRKLASDADEEGLTLSEFLDLVRPNLGKYERLPELEVVRDQPGGVQLLTIHRAKGLEFPVVILANTGNLGRSRGEGRRPYYLSDEYGLTLRVTDRGNYFYEIAQEENARKEAAELKRLLYVALTRARSHLVISGCHNRQNRTSDGVLLNMAAKVLYGGGLPAAGGEGEGLREEFAAVMQGIIPPVSESELSGRRSASSRERRAALLDRYEAAPVVEREVRRTLWSASELSSYLAGRIDEPSPERGLFPELTGTDRPFGAPQPLPRLESDPLIDELGLETAFGVLAHAVVGRRLSGAAEGALRIEELPSRLLRAIPPDRHAQLLADADSLAARFLESPLGRRAGAAAWRRSERGFLYRSETGCYVRGVIDLLFEDDGGVCVVDFKTDRELDANLHALQLHAYRLAASELCGTAATAYLFYLRSGESVEIDDDRLAVLYHRFFEVSPRGGAAEPSWSPGGEAAFTAFVDAAACDPALRAAEGEE